MKISDETDIKERLLLAGRQVFAEFGLKNAKVRHICDLAEANVAAVSYHFGSKEKLYICVIEDYLKDRNIRYPLDAGITEQSSPEDRLRAYVRGFLYKILGNILQNGDPLEKGLGRCVTQELLEPSRHFNELSEQHFKPCFNLLVDIVHCMAPELDDVNSSRCASSIIGQCVLFDFTKKSISQMIPELALETGNIETIMDFIIDFSLGGIEHLRNKHK